MSVVLLRNKQAAEYPLLPQSVYDDFADTGVSVITMPKGRWQLPGPGLSLTRSNVTVNYSGCTLMVAPDPGSIVPMRVQSVSVSSPVYEPHFEDLSPTRTISHLTGPIVPSTTTLTMDPDEVCDLQAGEAVFIWAGVTPSDPVECQQFIPAVVASVDPVTHVVTFTAGLGHTVVDYGDAAGLTAVVDPSLVFKVGDWGTWPTGANFSKGYGTDHGLERFVGGLVHDVTLNDPSFRIDRLTAFPTAQSSFEMKEIFSIAVQRLVVNRCRVHHPFGVAVHAWRTFSWQLNGLTLTGQGLARIFQVQTDAAVAVAMWGGDDQVIRDVEVTSRDTGLVSTEVGAGGITFQNVRCAVTFTGVRDTPLTACLCNFANVQGVPVLENLSLDVTQDGGSEPSWFTYAPCQLTGETVFGGDSLVAPLDWGYQKSLDFQGTVTIGGITYGPAISDVRDVAIAHGVGFRDVALPVGLYTSITVQVLTVGDLRDVSDLFGDDYWAELADSAVVPLVLSRWEAIDAGPSALLAYVGKDVRCWLNNAGSTDDALVRFVMTYLPAHG